jgi:hypothetical protein
MLRLVVLSRTLFAVVSLAGGKWIPIRRKIITKKKKFV